MTGARRHVGTAVTSQVQNQGDVRRSARWARELHPAGWQWLDGLLRGAEARVEKPPRTGVMGIMNRVIQVSNRHTSAVLAQTERPLGPDQRGPIVRAALRLSEASWAWTTKGGRPQRDLSGPAPPVNDGNGSGAIGPAWAFRVRCRAVSGGVARPASCRLWHGCVPSPIPRGRERFCRSLRAIAIENEPERDRIAHLKGIPCSFNRDPQESGLTSGCPILAKSSNSALGRLNPKSRIQTRNPHALAPGLHLGKAVP